MAINRKWKSGDTLRLRLPMAVRRVVADSRVAADRGRVMLQRGPVVYCVESADNPSLKTPEVSLPQDAKLSARFAPYLLGGVDVIKCDVGGNVMTAVPYCVWDNRDKSVMTVWMNAGK